MVPAAGAGWFSEAWLPSAFLPRYRGDPLAESRTHADGVMGHFAIGDRGAVDLALRPDAGQFVVIEAKIAGRLSPGVKNARSSTRPPAASPASPRPCAGSSGRPSGWIAVLRNPSTASAIFLAYVICAAP